MSNNNRTRLLQARRAPVFLTLLSFCTTLPATAQLLINEIMRNPSAVPDAAGEWFEVFNPTSAAVDIAGWTIRDDDLDSHVITSGELLLVPAGGFLVLGNNNGSSSNGGLDVDYQYADLSLSNFSDELILLDTGLQEVDRVEWDGGSSFPNPVGASMSVINRLLDNNIGTNWCTSETAFGDGDLGTPGGPNVVSCPEPIQIVITEILQNPSAVPDSAGEWFEVFNPTSAAIDINGWTVRDDGIDSFVITSGGPLTVAPGQYRVLGTNGDTASNGGVSVDYAYADLFLSNNADELILLDAGLIEIDRVEWDGGTEFPDPAGASMSLIGTLLDNNIGGNWCTSTAAFGSGDLGTPGAANVDCADSDHDGIADSDDNCITIPNFDQRDSNGDGFGNSCDADLNNDCIVNAIDLGILRLVFFSSDADADFSGDSMVNVVDLGIMRTLFFQPPGPSGVGAGCP